MSKAYPPETFSLIKAMESSLVGIKADLEKARYVVGVSGGMDSVVLLHLMAALIDQERLIVAHFDHKLREDSSSDAKFVETVAKTLGIVVEIGTAVDAPGKDNMESWARNRRYSFLESVRQKYKADWVLTAHNKNDQVETILMRIISGRMATKSFGIAKVDKARRLIRPLLDVTRKEIEACQSELKLGYREDPTNLDLNRTRNKIRRQLIPLLASEYNPRILDTVGEISSRLALDESYLWKEARQISLSQKWSVEEFIRLPFSIQWRVLEGWVDKGGLVGREVGFRALKLATERINQHHKDTFTLDLGACVRMNYSHKGGPKFEFYRYRT